MMSDKEETARIVPRFRLRFAPLHKWRLWASSRLVVAGGTLFAILMMALCAGSLYQSLLDTRQYAREALQNVSLIVERDIERNFELYALSLQAVVDGVKQPEIMNLVPRLQRQLLFDRAATAQYLGSMLVLNAQGNIVIDSDNDIPRPGNFADREYFQFQRDNPNAGLYISPPFESRLRNNSPSIALSRRLSNPDGSFAGVVVLAIQLQYFQKLFTGLTLGQDASISLLRSDGILTMRQPAIQGAIGRSFLHSKAFQHITGTEGTFSEITQLDGVRRLYAYRRIPNMPLIITVAAAEHTIYARWWRRAALIGVVMLISGVGFIALSFMLGAQLRRRMRAEAELELLAHTDGLTGLHNRRTLGDILDDTWRHTQRDRRVFSLLFVDIDHFKSYNDTYGHQVGDKALIAVARCIAEHIRPVIDSAARYGGEEFVVVLPDTDVEAAKVAAAKLLAAINALNITHAKSQYGHITVSIGAASWNPARHASIGAVIKDADDALYQAKAAGRNTTAISA